MMGIFQIGEFAKGNNTKLSVLAVEGQETGLQHVQQCAVVSGGTINVLNPLEMMRQLRLIAQNYIIATAVDVTVVLHSDLTFDEEGFLQVINLRWFFLNLQSLYEGCPSKSWPFVIK